MEAAELIPKKPWHVIAMAVTSSPFHIGHLFLSQGGSPSSSPRVLTEDTAHGAAQLVNADAAWNYHV